VEPSWILRLYTWFMPKLIELESGLGRSGHCFGGWNFSLTQRCWLSRYPKISFKSTLLDSPISPPKLIKLSGPNDILVTNKCDTWIDILAETMTKGEQIGHISWHHVTHLSRYVTECDKCVTWCHDMWPICENFSKSKLLLYEKKSQECQAI
jgi:hypothetical protein